MGRWTGSWLSGPAAAGEGSSESAAQGWPGQRLGLPADGPGSVAGYGGRTLAFFVDSFVANLLAGIPYLFGYRYGAGERGYVVLACFVLENLVLLSVAGQTVGYRVVGNRLVTVRRGAVLPLAVAVRTALLVLLIPALITDRDRRGMHDRAAGSVVVRSSPPVGSRGPQNGSPQPDHASNGASGRGKSGRRSP